MQPVQSAGKQQPVPSVGKHATGANNAAQVTKMLMILIGFGLVSKVVPQSLGKPEESLGKKLRPHIIYRHAQLV